jgi:tetratricopeptide (TPR) repeat protein
VTLDVTWLWYTERAEGYSVRKGFTMPNELGASGGTAHAGYFAQLGYRLLLVPEGVLLLAVLVVHTLSQGHPVLAVLVTMLVLSFTVRSITLQLARIALGTGRYRETHILLQIALALYPWSADTVALRGALLLVTGEPERASLALRQAIRLLPCQTHFYTALSNALLDLGQVDEACHTARTALTLDSGCALAYLALAEAEHLAGAAPLEVEQLLRNGLAVAEAPEAIAALQCALGAHLCAERRFAEGMLALHGAEAMLPRCSAPHQAELRFFLGELLTAQGHLERAREHFQGVEQLDPHGRFAASAWRAARL